MHVGLGCLLRRRNICLLVLVSRTSAHSYEYTAEACSYTQCIQGPLARSLPVLEAIQPVRLNTRMNTRANDCYFCNLDFEIDSLLLCCSVRVNHFSQKGRAGRGGTERLWRGTLVAHMFTLVYSMNNLQMCISCCHLLDAAGAEYRLERAKCESSEWVASRVTRQLVLTQ